ncbi:MAG TPA: LPS assembly lipoprotein LptE [Patescibacteria group bacterium]|nr:LPS assembly lipoprotein LptE [Patescibacteria group bacterium]
MRAVLLAAVLAFAGCGFHLREQTVLPVALQELRIEVSDRFSPIGPELARALKRAGARLTDDASAKVAVLRIHADAMNTVPLSVSGSARVQEYQVVHRIEFEVLAADGAVLVARNAIERRRDYRFDETQALGAAAEDELARKELRRDTLAALLRRIEAIR